MYLVEMVKRSTTVITPLGELVRRHRKRLGMTQTELAAAVKGIGRGAINEIENGGTLDPEVPTKIGLARVFGIDVDEIERAVRLSIQRMDAAEERGLLAGSTDTPADYWRKVLADHGGDREAALRFLHEAQAEGFRSD